MKLIKSSSQKSTNWGGGSTTELYIYPETEDYVNRNFSFRISTATVEVESSTFTALPNFSRVLMVLEGQMKLMHEGQHEILLNPFDKDSFDGGWTTRSEGACRDFNLMLGNGAIGDIVKQDLGLNESIQFDKMEHDHLAVYCFKGKGEINSNKEKQAFNNADLLVLNKRDRVSISPKTPMTLIMVFVDLGQGSLKGLAELLKGKN